MKMITIDGVQIPESKLTELGYTKQEAPKSKVFVPRSGEKYYFMDSNGSVDGCEWDNHQFDHNNQEQGNVFRTMDDAVTKSRRTYATVRVLNKLRELEGDSDRDFCLSYCSNHSEFVIEQRHRTRTQCQVEWYSSHLALLWVSENMRKDVLLMLGVSENED